jgi:hypothetical protein
VVSDDDRRTVSQAFPLPWRVEVNPFGVAPDGVDAVFIMDAEGFIVSIIAVHPVWEHKQKARMAAAKMIADAVNATVEGKGC